MIDKALHAVKNIFPKTKFARSVSMLVGATASSQALLMLAGPLLTRLYSPEDYGLVAVYVSVLGMLSVVSSLRYELAIPLPEVNLEAANVLVLSLLVTIVVTALTILVSFFFAESLCSLLGIPVLADYLWLLPLGVFFTGSYKVFNYWAIRGKNFSTIAHTRLRQSIITLAIQILGFKLGGIALIGGHAVGQGGGTIILTKPVLKSPEIRQVTWEGIKTVASKYRHFPLYSSMGGFVNIAGSQLPQIMFAMFFGAGAAGLYSLANKVISLPMQLVGSAIGQVFFSTAADAYRKDNLGPLVVNIHKKLSRIAMPPALILILAGPDLFLLVFGKNWLQSGLFARWMAPWLYFVFITSPLSTLFAVMEKQRAGLLCQLILLISRICAIGIGVYLNNLSVSIILFSASSTLYYVGFLFWIACLTRIRTADVIKPTLAAFAFSLPCLAPLALGVFLSRPTDITWICALSLSLLLVATQYWYFFRRSC